MVTASDLLRDLWMNYMKNVEIPRIKALLAIKKWPEYEMTVFVFPVNLQAFTTEIQGCAAGGGGMYNAPEVFRKYIVEPKHSGMSVREFVHKFLDKEFERHIISIKYLLSEKEDDPEDTTVSFVVSFREIDNRRYIEEVKEDD